MIGIIDLKLGNIGSIENMFKRLGVEIVISNQVVELEKCNRLVLPGVGSYDYGVKQLEKYNLIDFIKDYINNKDKYLLGICLGMQLLLESSEEGVKKGLGLISGKAIKFVFEDKSIKVPHMGWNKVEFLDSSLGKNLVKKNRFYFVHSFYAKVDEKYIAGKTNYAGVEFASMIRKNNIIGMQFHPEKSHKFGKTILSNFLELQ